MHLLGFYRLFFIFGYCFAAGNEPFVATDDAQLFMKRFQDHVVFTFTVLSACTRFQPG